MGEIYSAVLIISDDPEMNHLHWRRLVRLGTIPSAVFIVAAALFLHQSPFFLAEAGQQTAASQVLEQMRRDNGLPSERVDFRSPEREGRLDMSFESQLRKLWRGPLFPTTLILMCSCFNLNFAFYGGLYAFPTVLPTLAGAEQVSAGLQLVLGSLCSLSGALLGGFLGASFRRKPMIKVLWLVLVCCLILFAVGATHDGRVCVVLWHIGYYGMKIMTSSQFVVTYVYTSEVYPTSIRTTGCGFAFASGRLAAMLAPLAFEKLTALTGSYGAFFYVMAGSCLLNLLVIDFLPVETFNSALADSIKED